MCGDVELILKKTYPCVTLLMIINDEFGVGSFFFRYESQLLKFVIYLIKFKKFVVIFRKIIVSPRLLAAFLESIEDVF